MTLSFEQQTARILRQLFKYRVEDSHERSTAIGRATKYVNLVMRRPRTYEKDNGIFREIAATVPVLLDEIDRLTKAHSPTPSNAARSMKPKKYKLLKDLPGCPVGTIFTLWPGDDESPAQYEARQTDVRFRPLDKIDPRVVESNADWFELVQDRPYPFTPSVRDAYFHADPNDDTDYVFGYNWDGTGNEPAWLKDANIWRTQADAERRIQLEPLLNRALQAVINRGELAALEGAGFTIGRDNDAGWEVNGSANAQWAAPYQKSCGTVFSSREDAEAVVAFLKALFA